MFQSICLRRQFLNNQDSPIDIGFLTEAMLFYEHVHLVADYGIVEQLARHCGPDVLLALINEGFLKVHYIDRIVAIKTDNTGTSQERHKPATIHPHNLSWQLQNAAPVIFQQVTGKQGIRR